MKLMSQKPKAESRKLKVQSSKFKVLLSILKQNYLLLIFVGCIGFVGVVSAYKLFVVKPTYIYAKIKVGQGMWWASTQKPSLWYVKAIQSAGEQKDLTGKTVAKIMNVVYYPYWASGQYDVYVSVKLKVSKVGNKGTYNFNRETIGVSAPIDLEFPTVQFSGTVIALSEKPFQDIYVEKTVYLTKRIPLPWEYEQIEVGDSQTNGKQTVFTIIGKSLGSEADTTVLDQGTLMNSNISLFVVKAKILVRKVENQFLFGEESVIIPGKAPSSIGTDKFAFTDYSVLKLE